MKKSSSAILVFLLCISLILAGCGGSADQPDTAAPANDSGEGEQAAGSDDAPAGDGQTYNLRLSSEYPADNHQTIALNDAAELINQKSGGRITITVYPSNQLGDYTVVYGQVMTGDIDFAALPLSTTYDNRADILNLPYLATNYEEFKRDYFPGSYLWEVMADVNDNLGCTLLGVFNTGFMGIGAARLPSENFAELTDGDISKDTLIRIPASNVFQSIITGMGYRTTSIPYADLYPALQSGVADGWIGGSGLVNWESFRDIINYFIDCRAVNECVTVVMNKALLEGMSQEDQELVTTTFQDIALRVADERQEQEEQALVDLQGNGVTVISPTDAEMDVLRERMRAEIWGDMRETLGDEIIDNLCEIYGVTLEG